MKYRIVKNGLTSARGIVTAMVVAGSLLAVPGHLDAQDPDSTRVTELERRVELITRELERMRLGQEVVQADTSVRGFGPGASKVYQVERGISFGGYGAVLYENFASERDDGSPASARDRFDALRSILYVGYKFNDRLIFNSEIEIEHADEAFLEFAYLDYLFNENVGLRAGLLLAPLGFLNELHEPPTFLGTERPVTETVIIPSTWRENGVGLFGSNDQVSWRAYVMNSFDGTGFTASGLRGGRQKGSKALAEDMGFAARFDYQGTPGLILGASGFFGETGQGRELDGEEVGGAVTIWDLHADYKVRGWELRGLIAGASVDDAAELNELNGLTGSAGVGSEMLGGYVQVGYDILRTAPTSHQLLPYIRYEKLNTQHGVAEGFSADPAKELTIASFGAAWKPDPQVVFKLGYQLHSNGADRGLNQWNVQIGWLF